MGITWKTGLRRSSGSLPDNHEIVSFQEKDLPLNSRYDSKGGGSISRHKSDLDAADRQFSLHLEGMAPEP
jgi:hypothetical protein